MMKKSVLVLQDQKLKERQLTAVIRKKVVALELLAVRRKMYWSMTGENIVLLGSETWSKSCVANRDTEKNVSLLLPALKNKYLVLVVI